MWATFALGLRFQYQLGNKPIGFSVFPRLGDMWQAGYMAQTYVSLQGRGIEREHPSSHRCCASYVAHVQCSLHFLSFCYFIHVINSSFVLAFPPFFSLYFMYRALFFLVTFLVSCSFFQKSFCCYLLWILWLMGYYFSLLHSFCFSKFVQLTPQNARLTSALIGIFKTTINISLGVRLKTSFD